MSTAHMTESIEVWQEDDGEIVCKYGTLCRASMADATYGVLKDVGPLILLGADFEQERRNLASFGIKYRAENGYAYVDANNGSWVWRLEPMHWRDGIKPDPHLFDELFLGRWPD